MKRSPLLIGASALVLVFAGMGALTVRARGQTAQPSPAPQQCTPDAVQSVMALHPDGTQSPASPNDGQGRIYTFENGLATVNPPPHFNPSKATDQELATYGFEPRPSDLAGMNRWHSLYANYHNDNDNDIAPTMCRALGSAGWWVAQNPHWSGAVNNAAPPEGYWTSQLGFKQTAFDDLSGCASYTNSSYYTWAGLGGYYSGKLVQAGTATGVGSINELHNFLELIDARGFPAGDHGMHFFNNNLTAGGDFPRPGDNIYVSVKNNENVYLEFAVNNQTKGYNDVVLTGPPNYYDGLALTQYIDAQTAEYITENSQSAYPFLRKPHLGNTSMFWEQADQASMTSFGRFGLDEYSWRYMQQIETSPPTAGWNGNPGFYDQWENCW